MNIKRQPAMHRPADDKGERRERERPNRTLNYQKLNLAIKKDQIRDFEWQSRANE